jgi:NDP-4-keto-2,6-dideoxyhexose 3-C-methyltransferase
MYVEIKRCRICGNENLTSLLDLGMQALTGVFPRERSEVVDVGPLELVRCDPQAGPNACGLVQLRHSFNVEQMYGSNYGYRSGLNASMVEHLRSKVDYVSGFVSLSPDDVVLDIGANDGTLLGHFAVNRATLIGIDPSAERFRPDYRADIRLATRFFDAETFRELSGGRKAKIIFSIAMFYDLEDPRRFVEDISASLADDGVWHFEQSYLPAMLDATSYDTVCHEHLEYYSLSQVTRLLTAAGLTLIDVVENDINGGSFAVTAAKAGSPLAPRADRIDAFRQREAAAGLDDPQTYSAFAVRVREHRDTLLRFFDDCRKSGRRVLGYGASTKGNVLLQYCRLTEAQIPAIAEVNADKYGRYTPGSMIPIVSEAAARDMGADAFLVLPWHFRKHIVRREAAWLQSGRQLVFPLPTLTQVG